MLLPISGRCYGHFLCNVVADGMATIGWGDGSVADVITTGQMVLPGVNILF